MEVEENIKNTEYKMQKILNTETAIESTINKGGGYLSKENCVCLKGILAIFVLVSHLYGASGLFKGTLFGAVILQSLGELAVAVFFFLSGYGLMYSYKKNKQTYLKSFFHKRIMPFYVIILNLILIYSIFAVLLDNKLTLAMFIKALIFGGEIVGNGWYLQVQLLLYFLFYFGCKICKKTYLLIVTISLLEIVYCIIAMLCGLSGYWYQSVLTFIGGLIWAAYKEKIDSFLRVSGNKNAKTLFAGVLLLFSCIFLIKYYIDEFVVKILFKMLSNILFAVLTVMFIYFVPINCTLTRWLGRFSLEIYVLQGIFLALYHSQFIYLEGAYVYIVAVISSTVAAAYFWHPVNVRVYRFFGKSTYL